MKIELNDLRDIRELFRMLDPALLRKWQALRDDTSDANANTLAGIRAALAAEEAQPQGLPADIEQPGSIGYPVSDRTYEEVQKDAEGAHEALVGPERDADGALYDPRWHSEPMKLTDKGVFRARRGRDNDAYKAWLLEQATESAAQAIGNLAAAIDPEDYAPPQDDGVAPVLTQQEVRDAQDEPPAPVSTVDLEALIAASLEAAQDASDSHVDLLNACRDFTSKYGHQAFTALKAAVAPDDAYPGGGKAVQHFTPGERRLMQACIANYPSN